MHLINKACTRISLDESKYCEFEIEKQVIRGNLLKPLKI